MCTRLLNSKFGWDKICWHFWQSQTNLLNLVWTFTVPKPSLILPLILQPYLSSVLSANPVFFFSMVFTITELSKRAVSKLISQFMWLVCSLEIKWLQKVRWQKILCRWLGNDSKLFLKNWKSVQTMRGSTIKNGVLGQVVQNPVNAINPGLEVDWSLNFYVY